MSSAYKIKVILLQKLYKFICTKRTWNTSVTLPPTFSIGARIRPKHITEETIIRDLSRPLNILYLVQTSQLGWETTMHAQYLVINQCSNRQAVEAIREYLPESNIEPPLTFVIETIYSVDFRIFVVPSQQENLFRVPDFVCKQQAYSLQALFASIDIVSKEYIGWSRRITTQIEQSQKVNKLAMDITCRTPQLIRREGFFLGSVDVEEFTEQKCMVQKEEYTFMSTKFLMHKWVHLTEHSVLSGNDGGKGLCCA